MRRPGYPADRWAEDWLVERFQALGMERVRREPVRLPYWEPLRAALTAFPGDRAGVKIPCFALPHTADADGLELELSAFEVEAPERVQGRAALCETPLMRTPFGYYQHVATWTYDPDGSFDGASQVLPFAREIQDVTRHAISAGAAAFIGALSQYPGDSYEYYVPYDAVLRPIPSVWIRGSDGERLRAMLDEGTVRVRLTLQSRREEIECHNIAGELPGADDETVIIGSHHDGPWASAVEDASGIALVLAQASYWSAVPREARPHRLVFLLNSGHMSGGAGQCAFVETHRAELERCVLEVHLEHAANEIVEDGDGLRATGRPEARWWFTSQIPRLEEAVRDAIEAEDLRRSFVLRPDTFGEKPTTDGADFHLAGVPLVNYLVAPFYLFDAMDTLDKIHRPSLEPVTRAAIRIIESTRGVSAAEMRFGAAAK